MLNRMSIPKNQHWVPRFYLNGFCTQINSGSIHVTNIKDVYAHREHKPEKLKIRDVAVLSHLYNFVDPSGGVNTTVDAHIGSIERAVDPIWKAMLEKKGTVPMLKSGSSERKVVARFMASQHLRTPRMVAVSKYVAKHSNGGVPDTRTEAGRDAFYAEVAAIEVDHSSTPEGMLDRADFLAAQITEVDTVSNVLENMHWSIRDYGSRCLITSDTPLFSVEQVTMMPVAIGSSKSLVFFPLTSQHLLIASVRCSDATDGVVNSHPATQAAGINPFIAHFATDEVYSATALTDSFPFLRDPPPKP